MIKFISISAVFMIALAMYLMASAWMVYTVAAISGWLVVVFIAAVAAISIALAFEIGGCDE